MRRIIEDAMQLLAYRAKRDAVLLSFRGDPQDPFNYRGNPAKLHQVVINLVLNAVESFEEVPPSERHQRLVIVELCREQDNEIVLRVEDNGSGIPGDLKKKIFEPFFSTKIRDKKGTGIGLAITKKIVEGELGGQISLDDANDGGAIFTVRFPNSYP